MNDLHMDLILAPLSDVIRLRYETLYDWLYSVLIEAPLL